MDATALANLVAWSLQVAAIVLVGGTLPWLLRLHHPAARHAWWRALLAGCLLLPLVQPWHAPGTGLAQAPAAGDLGLLSGAGPGAASPSVFNVMVVGISGVRWPAIVTWLLLAGMLARLTYLAAGVLHLRRLRRAALVAAPADPAAGGAGVEIRYGDRVRQPVTFGWRRPIVLLPLALRSQPAALRRAVIEHELWHVRRRDWRWVMLEEIVRAVFWFHPAILWLVSRVQLSREELVDRLTVESSGSRRHYLEALLAFAEEPTLHPAAPFARRRHLFHRMLLISREAAMSSRRAWATCVVMAGAVLAGGWYGVAAFPLAARSAAAAPAAMAGQTQVRDPRPGEARPATEREETLRQQAAAQPTRSAVLELAKLQESRGALGEAEATLQRGAAALPDDLAVTKALAGFYSRNGRADLAMQVIDKVAASNPGDQNLQHLSASFAEELVRKDLTLSVPDRLSIIDAGLAAEDRALAVDPEYVDALVLKNILLRHKASITPDTAARSQLVAEADALRARAIELREAARSAAPSPGVEPATPGMPPPPPPPPPPSAFDGATVDGRTPLRVGGPIKPPMKLRNVQPEYPQDAMDAKIQGVVVLGILVDGEGTVRDAKVMRSVPMLDAAAMEAVRQWTFTPTLLNGTPVPVEMTVTVNFTLR